MPYTTIGSIGEMTLGEGVSMGNKMAMLTRNNIVCFGDDATLMNYTAGQTLATLPDTLFRPLVTVLVPVCLTPSNGIPSYAVMTVTTEGTISINENVDSGTLHLAGVCFTVNSRYYTPQIGNIYNNGTSPLSAI